MFRILTDFMILRPSLEMTMKTTTIFILSIFSSLLMGQGLVENLSLENTGPCPIFATDIEDIATPWTADFGTPDYFHVSCGFPGDASSTNNAIPFDGDGFAGIAMYGDTGTAYVREYLHGKLKFPLTAGQFYRVTFYVKPVNNSVAGWGYAINNIGMHLSNEPLDTIPLDKVLPYKPQVYAVDPVVAESYWSAVCGVFEAKGGEEYITIGNFKDDAGTDAVPLLGATGPQGAYYLIDYVEVVPNDLPQLPKDTIICTDQRIDVTIDQPDVTVEWNDGFTGKNFVITSPGTYSATISSPGCTYVDTLVVAPANCVECKLYIPNAFTPNGDHINDLFEIKASCAEELVEYHLMIYDRWGQKVYESYSINQPWNGGEFLEGVYVYNVEYTYPLYRQTQTLSRRGTITLIK